MFSERESKILMANLKIISDLGDQCDALAYAINGLLEGDDPEEAAALLQKYGYTDEDGFWKYDEEEEDDSE